MSVPEEEVVLEVAENEIELRPAIKNINNIAIQSHRTKIVHQFEAGTEEAEKGLQLIRACRKGDLSQVKQTVSEGAPIAFITENGWTPLNWAASCGHYEIVLHLLSEGANEPYLQRKRNEAKHGESITKENTPLHWACYKGHIHIAYLLINWEYSVEDLDPCENRPLHLACSGNQRSAVELLLAHGAEIVPKNVYGNTPIDLTIDVSVRKLLYSVLEQTFCNSCKKMFNGTRGYCFCQHCQLLFCSEDYCSGRKEVPWVDNIDISRSVRYCKSCIDDINSAESDLRLLLREKLNHMYKENTMKSKELEQKSTDSKVPNEVVVEGEPNLVPDSDENSKIEDAEVEVPESQQNDGEGLAMEEDDNTADTNTLDSAEGTMNEGSDDDEIVPSLTQKDIEPLYSCIIEAEKMEVDPHLIIESKDAYKLLSASINLKTEIEALNSFRPAEYKSVLVPLKEALQKGIDNGLEDIEIKIAMNVIRSVESECALHGYKTLCSRIKSGSAACAKDVQKLLLAIQAAETNKADEKLIEEAINIHSRLSGEITLQASMKGPKEIKNPDEEAAIVYEFADGHVCHSLLEVLDHQVQILTEAIETSQGADISETLMEDAQTLQKKLKKDLKEENKKEEERKRLEEEAALKAAKKAKGKKKKK